jgi:23S rRNA (uracil1939-C5)-methyltransferase
MRLKIESLVHGGFGLARSEGVVFVPFVVPGETVEAEIVEKKKGYAFARLVEVLEPSPRRVAPPCPVYGRCGGCHLQHMAYEAQVEAKQGILKETLRRATKVDIQPGAPLTGEPFGYRHRAVFKISSKGEIGFFGQKSNTIVAMDQCLLLVEGLNAVLTALREDPDRLKGVTEMEAAAGLDGIVLSLQSGGLSRDRLTNLMKALPGVTGIRDGKSRGFVGDASVHLSAGGLPCQIRIGNFFQANQKLNSALVEAVLDTLEPLDGATVLDAYAGSGNFALPLAKKAARVVAVEGNPSAVEDARANVKNTGLTNCPVLAGALETVRLSGKFNATVLDPPRTGLSAQALDRLLTLGPGKILYVSCDPATLARDVRRFSLKCMVESVRLVDMFPQTYHVETLVLMKHLERERAATRTSASGTGVMPSPAT